MVILPRNIGQIIDIFTLASFFIILFTIEPTFRSNRNLFIALFSTVVIGYIDLFYNMASIPLLAILYFILLKRTKISVFKWISNFVVSLLFTFFTAQLSSFLTVKLLGIGLGKVENNLTLLVTICLTLTIFIVATLLVLRHLIIAIIAKFRIDNSFSATILGYNAASLLIFLILTTSITRWFGKESALMSFIFIIFGILVFLMLFATVILYSKNIKALQVEHRQELNKDNTLYIKELEKKYQESRKAKHDYKNMLLALQAIAKNGNNDALYSNVRALLQSDTEFEDDPIQILSLQKISDPLVNGIITQKLTEANNKKITTNLEVTKEIPKLGKLNIIVTRILGILLDNAIESAVKSVDRKISVAALNENSRIEFIIINSVANDAEININQIFDEGYSSKGSNHGLGLSTVKDLTSHYDNMLISVTLTDTFTVILTIENTID